MTRPGEVVCMTRIGGQHRRPGFWPRLQIGNLKAQGMHRVLDPTCLRNKWHTTFSLERQPGESGFEILYHNRRNETPCLICRLYTLLLSENSPKLEHYYKGPNN